MTANSSDGDSPPLAYDQLLEAVGSGDALSVRRLLDAHPELANEADRDGRTPLLVAAARGEAGTVQILLDHDAGLGTCTSPDADVAYDAVVAHFCDSAELSLRVLAADALLQKGWALIQGGDLGRAAEVFEEVVHRYGDAGELPLRRAVATALDNRAFALLEDGRRDESLLALDELMDRFGVGPEVDILQAVAGAMKSRAEALLADGRLAEAAAAHAEVDLRFGDSQEPTLRRRAVAALLERCLLLAEAGRPGEAADARSELLGRFDSTGEPEPWGWMAWALGRDDDLFDRIDPGREELLGLVDRIARFIDDDGRPGLRALIAGAHLAAAETLGRLGRHEEAADACDELVRSLAAAESPALQDIAAAARELGRLEAANHWLRAAMNHRVLDDFAGALGLYDRVIAGVTRADGPVLRLRGARALLGRGLCLDRLGDPDGAALAFAGIVHSYAEAGGPGVRRLVALSRVFLAVVLTEQGRDDEAAAARQDVARLGIGPGAVPLWDWIELAFGSGGGRFVAADLLTEDPGEVADRIVRCFGTDDDPGLRNLVAGAMRSRA